MAFRSLVAGIAILSYSLPSVAALVPAGRFPEARFALARGAGEDEFTRLKSGIKLSEAIDLLKKASPGEEKYWDELLAKRRLNPKEMLRLREWRAIPNGWAFRAPGVEKELRLTLGTAAKPELRLNGRPLPMGASAPALYREVRDILLPKQASSIWDWAIPRAEANPVVVLPALGALGIVVVVHAVTRYFSPTAEAAMEAYFRDAAATCEKESAAAKVIYESSETAALVGRLLAADIVSLPNKPGSCESFVAKAQKPAGERQAQDAAEACRAADAFLACAEKMKGRAAKINRPLPSKGAAGAGAIDIR